MDLQELQTSVAAKIRSLEILRGLPVVEEELGNVIESVQTEIDRTCFCVVVGSASFNDETPDSRLCHGKTSVKIHIFENPTLNRKIKTRPTYLKVAQELTKELKLFNTGDGLLTSPTIGEPQDLGDGVVSVIVTFTTKTTL